MRKIISIIVIALFLTQSFAYGQGGPGGDECNDPKYAYAGANSFSTLSVTPSFPEPDDAMCAGTSLNWNASPDIWFEFVPTSSGLHTFTTCDVTSYDTSIVLYEGNCSNQVACNGDGSGSTGCQSYYSAIEYYLSNGVTYYIRIGGWNGDVGEGTLTIDPSSGGNNIWYVDIDNTNPGSGTDWASAFTDVQDALDVAVMGDQIWIAEGTYLPSDTGGSSDPREASFRLSDGVEVYGGFMGNEVDIDFRLPTQYRVTLLGDLNGDDQTSGDNSENTYHVVTAEGISTASPILDGVSIVGGNADGSGSNKYGGGIIVKSSGGVIPVPCIVRSCLIRNNVASEGGAVATHSSLDAILMNRCVLANNKANYGGAISNVGYCQINNMLIIANQADIRGGAIYNTGQYFDSINSTIVQNHGGSIGGIYSEFSALQSTNTILWGNTDDFGDNAQFYATAWSGNYNCIQFLDQNLGGIGNIGAHPRFLDEFGGDGLPGTGDENFRLLQRSPCIDAGDTTLVSSPKDLDGNARVVDDPYTADTGVPPSSGGPVVDMGAYEHAFGSNDFWIWSGSNSDYFYDSENWLPQGVPNTGSNCLFSSTGYSDVTFDQTAQIHGMFFTEGSFTLALNWNLLILDAASRPLRVDAFGNGATVTFKDGDIIVKGGLNLDRGNVSFENITLNVGEILLERDAICNFDGWLVGDLTNNGSVLSTAGRDTGSFQIQGFLMHQGDGDASGRLVGSMPFDMYGLTSGVSHDHLAISGAVDMSCSIDLRWNREWTPEVGDSLDLISVGSSSGEPTVVYNSGLPSNLSIRWSSPIALRSSHEVVVETTGPILFGTESTHDLSSANVPSDIVVADLNNDNFSDVAISIPATGGANGSVVILFNNGMSGNTWLGFTESNPILVGIDPMDIEVGDLNDDGTANDLVVANNGSDTVSILSNDNTGTFTKETDVSTDSGPMFITITDFVEETGLSRDDIIVACSSLNASVLNKTTFRSKAINFTHTNSISIPFPGDIDPGDINTDKDIDLIVLDTASTKVRVMDGNGDGTVATVPLGDPLGNPLPSGSGPVELVLFDIDDDGDNDVITVNETSGSLSVLLSDVVSPVRDNGSELGNTSTFSIGTDPDSLTVYDFDNDGDEDIVVSFIGVISGNRELTVIRNDTASPGGTVILSEGDASGSGSEPVKVKHGNFNNDGVEDLAAVIDLGSNGPGIGIYFNATEVVVNCPADIDGDGFVAVGDILAIIGAWGTVNPDFDLDESGIVDVGDILLIVSNWGPC